MVKGRFPICCPNSLEGKKRSYYGLLFLYDKSKRNNRKKKHYVKYSDVPSAIRPIPYSPDLPVPEPNSNMEYSPDFEHSNMTVVDGYDTYKLKDDQPIRLTQAELNDLKGT